MRVVGFTLLRCSPTRRSPARAAFTDAGPARHRSVCRSGTLVRAASDGTAKSPQLLAAGASEQTPGKELRHSAGKKGKINPRLALLGRLPTSLGTALVSGKPRGTEELSGSERMHPVAGAPVPLPGHSPGTCSAVV